MIIISPYHSGSQSFLLAWAAQRRPQQCSQTKSNSHFSHSCVGKSVIAGNHSSNSNKEPLRRRVSPLVKNHVARSAQQRTSHSSWAKLQKANSGVSLSKEFPVAKSVNAREFRAKGRRFNSFFAFIPLGKWNKDYKPYVPWTKSSLFIRFSLWNQSSTKGSSLSLYRIRRFPFPETKFSALLDKILRS